MANEEQAQEFSLSFRLVDNGRELVHIEANVTLEDGEDAEPEIRWLHPLTGGECENLDQVFTGWSDQDPATEAYWAELAQAIRDDEMLDQRVCDTITPPVSDHIDYQHVPDWQPED